MGIVGGRPGSSLYFVGVQGHSVLYLDPHEVQDVSWVWLVAGSSSREQQQGGTTLHAAIAAIVAGVTNTLSPTCDPVTNSLSVRLRYQLAAQRVFGC